MFLTNEMILNFLILLPDPLPIFLNPAEQYSFNATENGPETLGLLKVSVRARSLGSAYAQMSFVIISGE